MSSRSVLLLNIFICESRSLFSRFPSQSPALCHGRNAVGCGASRAGRSLDLRPPPPGPAGSFSLCCFGLCVLLQPAECVACLSGVLSLDVSPGNPEAGSSRVAGFPEAPWPPPWLPPARLTHAPSEFPFRPEASLLSTMPGIPDLGAPNNPP